MRGLRQALGPRHPLAALLIPLEAALSPLASLTELGEPASLAAWIPAHIRAAEALAESPDRLWADEEGEALAVALDGLLAAASDFTSVAPRDYPAVFDELLRSRTVRPRYGKHPRLAILGPLEARLQCPDLVVLGGLNDGSWPPEPERDPWMGRPMRRHFGLPLPEWRIGLAAHDFTQAFAAPEVLLTRAERVDGAPTVPTRWLARLELAARAAADTPSDADPHPLKGEESRWLAWADALDRPATFRPGSAPRPTPPVVHRFGNLYVTDVERWVRDPYGHYAGRLLKLRKLDVIDQAPDAGDRGEILHQALKRFVDGLPKGEWPGNARERLLAIGREAFGPLLDRPEVEAFWWRRFLRMAEWFLAHEVERRDAVRATRTEHSFAADVPVGEALVKLQARVDRLDELADGSRVIIDYKSGTLPTAGRMAEGWPPQLPLEAVLLLSAPDASVDGIALEAWDIGGSGDEGGKAAELTGGKGRKVPAEQVVAAAGEGLGRLLKQFVDPTMPYLAEPRADLAPRYNDYRHLARISGEGEDDVG